MGAEITIPLKIDEVKRSSEKERIIPVKDHGGHDGGGGVGGGGRGGDGEGEGDGAGDGGGGGGVNEADVVATRRPEDGISHKVKKAIKKGKVGVEPTTLCVCSFSEKQILALLIIRTRLLWVTCRGRHIFEHLRFFSLISDSISW